MLTISDCKTLKRHTLAAKAKSNAAGQASQQVQKRMVSPEHYQAQKAQVMSVKDWSMKIVSNDQQED